MTLTKDQKNIILAASILIVLITAIFYVIIPVTTGEWAGWYAPKPTQKWYAPISPQPKCVDSDASNDVHVKGKAAGTNQTIWDKCNADNTGVFESYCGTGYWEGKAFYFTRAYGCPANEMCYDGVCQSIDLEVVGVRMQASDDECEAFINVKNNEGRVPLNARIQFAATICEKATKNCSTLYEYIDPQVRPEFSEQLINQLNAGKIVTVPIDVTSKVYYEFHSMNATLTGSIGRLDNVAEKIKTNNSKVGDFVLSDYGGACLPRCTDSDVGENSIYVKGRVSSLIQKPVGVAVDYCIGTTGYLSEASCDSEGKIALTTVKCPDGCSDGACIK